MDYFGIVVIVWMHSGNEKNEVGIRFNEPIKKGTKNINLNSSQYMTSKNTDSITKPYLGCKSNVFLNE